MLKNNILTPTPASHQTAHLLLILTVQPHVTTQLLAIASPKAMVLDLDLTTLILLSVLLAAGTVQEVITQATAQPPAAAYLVVPPTGTSHTASKSLHAQWEYALS